jgi:hypothetical protein
VLEFYSFMVNILKPLQVTTVSTTPLTRLLYPPSYQRKLEKWKRGEIDWDGNPIVSEEPRHSDSTLEKLKAQRFSNLLVQIRLDALPSLFTFIPLLSGTPKQAEEPSSQTSEIDAEETGKSETKGKVIERKRPLQVRGLRILELTERTSSVMKVTETEEYARRDPVVQAFATFSRLQGFAVAGRVAVVPPALYAETIVNQASESSSDFVLIPWCEDSHFSDDQSALMGGSAADRFTGKTQLDFVAETFQRAVCNTGVFIDDGFGGMGAGEKPRLTRARSGLSIQSVDDSPLPPAVDKGHRIFLPFFGGVDDRASLRFVLQVAENSSVTATVAHFRPPMADPSATGAGGPSNAERGFEDSAAEDASLIATLQASLPVALMGRVIFTEINVGSESVMKDMVKVAKQHVGTTKNSGDIVVAGRRHSRLLDKSMANIDMRRATGVVAEKIALSGVKASVLVIQAGGLGQE